MDIEELDDLFDEELGEILEFVEYERRPYTVKERMNPFEELDDVEFTTRFRLSKPSVLMILQQIEGQLETITDRNHSIRPINQLLVTLRFYATGNFLLTVADLINVSKASACKIVKKVSYALASLARHYIKMPTTEEEIQEIQRNFYAKARLPRVIGSLDCTHIRIQNPGGNNAETFRNRKGYFSINVQTISDHNLRILDIVARWPGSSHDQTVFDNSNIRRRLLHNEFPNCLIVADSGYANTMHIITPLLNANTEVEQLYNEAGNLRRTRNPVERQYGVLKRRFPILSTGLRLKLNTSMAVIVACAVLHNIAIAENEDLPNVEETALNIDFDEEIQPEGVAQNNINNARDNLINDYFRGLVAQQ